MAFALSQGWWQVITWLMPHFELSIMGSDFTGPVSINIQVFVGKRKTGSD
jgi:hypothetical protein